MRSAGYIGGVWTGGSQPMKGKKSRGGGVEALTRMASQGWAGGGGKSGPVQGKKREGGGGAED